MRAKMRRKDLRLRSLNQHVCQHAHTHTHTHLHTLTWHYWEMVFHVFDQVSNRKDHVLSAALHWCASGELNHVREGICEACLVCFTILKEKDSKSTGFPVEMTHHHPQRPHECVASI
jgi:hypothetical protein